MESQSLILGLLIAALAVLFVLWPFVSTRRQEAGAADSGSETARLETLAAQRDAIYATLRDLDFDYATGKLTEDDYRSQRAGWVEQGVAALKALDAAQADLEHAAPAANGSAESRDAVQADHAAVPEGDLEARIEAAVAARRRTTA